MNKAFSLVKELGLDKWIINIDETPEEPEYRRILLVIYFKNEYWNWEFGLMEDPDFDDGYFGIRNLNSNDESYRCGSPNYFILELSEDTLYRDNFLFLITCCSLDDFFHQKFSYLEELEDMLRKHFTIEVPIPIQKSSIWVTDWFDNYRIKIYKKNTSKEVCIAIPLLENKKDTEYKLYFYKFGKLFGDDEMAYVPCQGFFKDFTINERRLYEGYYGDPENIGFDNVPDDVYHEVLNIQESYPKIDKNIFKQIIKELNFSYILDKINSLNF